jgi:hypothetical protein
MALYNESFSILGIDRIQGGNAYENVLVIVLAGTITDGTHTVVPQHSDDGTTWTNVPAGNISGTIPGLLAAQSNTAFDLGISTARRFVRLNVTVGGAPATGGIISAVFVLGDPSYLPAR